MWQTTRLAIIEMLLPFLYTIVPVQLLAALLRDIFIDFVHLVLWKVAVGLTNENLINEIVWKTCWDFSGVATITR